MMFQPALWVKRFTLGLSGCLSVAARATYPEKPVRIGVGFLPGQAANVIARFAAKKTRDVLKLTVIVDNKAGAAGTPRDIINAIHNAFAQA